MPYIFIPKANDPIHKIEDLDGVKIEKEICFETLDPEPEEEDLKTCYWALKVGNISKEVYILKSSAPNQDNSEFWNQDNMSELFKRTREELPNNRGLIYFAIHWGGRGKDESQNECDKIESIGENLFLTYYSSTTDKEYLEKFKNEFSLELFNKFANRIKHRAEHQVELRKVRELNRFKYNSIRLFLSQTIETKIKIYSDDDIEELSANISDSDCSKQASDILEKLEHAICDETDKNRVALQEFRKDIDKLIDKRFKNIGENTIYGG